MKKLKQSTSSVKSKLSGLDSADDSDILTVDVHSLRLFGADAIAYPKSYLIKVAFLDEMITCCPIEGVDGRMDEGDIARADIYGEFCYDITDIERMCLMADHPLIVQIHPTEKTNPGTESSTYSPPQSSRPSIANTSARTTTKILRVAADTAAVTEASEHEGKAVSVGYVDILPLLTGKEDKICVRKRLKPLYQQPTLQRKSWENLPLVTMEIGVKRLVENTYYHNILKNSNYMKFTLVGLYNVPVSFGELSSFVAATKMPVDNEENSTVEMFQRGSTTPKYFKSDNFFSYWETMRSEDNVMAESDEKTVLDMDKVVIDEMDVKKYFDKSLHESTVIWRSFHRTLFTSDKWFKAQITQFKWPIEAHTYGDNGCLALMGQIDLFRFLYPGVDVVQLAVPVTWTDPQVIRDQCGIEPLLTGGPNNAKKGKKKYFSPTPTTSLSLDVGSNNGPSGVDGNEAFVIVEVKLGRPLRKAFILPTMTNEDICAMLCDLEKMREERKCTARAKLEDNWQNIVGLAVSSLKKVPQYGAMNFCTFIRQFADTRTKLEIHSSFCDEAAVYVHNQFVTREFLTCDSSFELSRRVNQELLMIAHTCLLKSAFKALKGEEKPDEREKTIRAARHARQLQDLPHAIDLYAQALVEQRKNSDYWRELAVCLKDVDRDWAIVCLYQSLLLNPRHPLTLLALAGTIYEEDPEATEPFILALLHLFPVWTTAWVIATAYYIERQKYDFADTLTEMWKRSLQENVAQDLKYPRAWEYELGDWWDTTPILPGMSRYYDAADLLLRLRAMSLAEVCLARSLLESGDSAPYYHLLALSCRLRDDAPEAVCHIDTALNKYGEIYYLRTLEAECLHKLNKIELAMTSIAKSLECNSRFSLLLSLPSLERQRRRPVIVDLIRRQPSAYSWLALAEDWLDSCALDEFSSVTLNRETVALYVRECAIQALKCDKRAGRAWDLLASLMETEVRQNHCLNMAMLCRYYVSDDKDDLPDYKPKVQPDICYRYGYPVKKCHCNLCAHIVVN